MSFPVNNQGPVPSGFQQPQPVQQVAPAAPQAQPIQGLPQQSAAPLPQMQTGQSTGGQTKRQYVDAFGTSHESYDAFLASLPTYSSGAVEVLNSNLKVPGVDQKGVLKKKFDISIEICQSNQEHVTNILTPHNEMVHAVTGGVQPSFIALKQKMMRGQKCPQTGQFTLIDKPGFLRTRLSASNRPGVFVGPRNAARPAQEHELQITPKSIVDLDFKLVPIKFTDRATNQPVTGVSLLVVNVYVLQLAEAYKPASAPAQAPMQALPATQGQITPQVQGMVQPALGTPFQGLPAGQGQSMQPQVPINFNPTGQ